MLVRRNGVAEPDAIQRVVVGCLRRAVPGGRLPDRPHSSLWPSVRVRAPRPGVQVVSCNGQTLSPFGAEVVHHKWGPCPPGANPRRYRIITRGDGIIPEYYYQLSGTLQEPQSGRRDVKTGGPMRALRFVLPHLALAYRIDRIIRN